MPLPSGATLVVDRLVTTFATPYGPVKAANAVSFSIDPGQTLGLVGESGSGKSVTALSIMRLIQGPGGEITSGSVRLQGEELLTLSEAEMCQRRGELVSMIFQEPMTSLNPLFTVGEQIGEVLRLHQGLDLKAAQQQTIALLEQVRIPAAQERMKAYPHELSGGMRQRVMIAMALACKPALLIADEPTTALDVTIQAQILDLLRELQQELGMAILFITHDLGVVAELCDHVAVMYAGKIIEKAPVGALFQSPQHPYTQGLLQAIPGRALERGEGSCRLTTIPGTVPPLHVLPPGCSFQDRCSRADVACRGQKGIPLLQEAQPQQAVACFHPLTISIHADEPCPVN